MQMSGKFAKHALCLLLMMSLALLLASCSKKEPAPESKKEPSVAEQKALLESKPEETKAGGADEMVALEIELPKPVFRGTPQDIRVPNLEKPRGEPRPPFYAPAGTKIVSHDKVVYSSDEEPIIGEIELINDGDKAASEGSYVELGPFVQYVTIDLEQPYEIYAILVWHFHMQPRVYKDVVVQVADDVDFTMNVRTLFNNDHDNSAGLGVGEDLHYVETSEGRLIDGKGVQAQFVRLYSNGNTHDDMNHYTEVEIWGKPVE